MESRTLVVWMLFGVLSVGCSSSTITDDAGADATTDAVVDVSSAHDAAPGAEGGIADAKADAPVPDASGCSYSSDAGQCNSLPSPTKVAVGCASSPPPPSGGTVVDGVYVMTQADWDSSNFDGGCPANQTHGATLEICGDVLEWSDLDTTNSSFVGSFVFAPNGSQLPLTQFCPGASAPYSVGYTASGTDLWLWLTYPNGPTLRMHFTRQ